MLLLLIVGNWGKLLAVWSFLVEIGNAAIWEVANMINFVANFTNIGPVVFVIVTYVRGTENGVLTWSIDRIPEDQISGL